MSFGNLLIQLTESDKRLIRDVERTRKKLVRCKYSRSFNLTCLTENVLPNYSNIKTHDPAVRDKQFTKDYRRKLVEHQLNAKTASCKRLQQELDRLNAQLSTRNIEPCLLTKIKEELDKIAEKTDHATNIRTTKKLSKLYGGHIMLPQSSDGYINLSSVDLTEEQKELLNLGLNCHIQTRFDEIEKQADLELLYQDILKLEKEKKVEVNSRLKDQMVGESSKVRSTSKSKIMTEDLRKAAKDLRENENIVIRRADKSNIFVILDKDEYLEKMNSILNDTSKFSKLSRDPTKTLTTKLNKMIDTANAASCDIHFTKIIGEYSPGYAYGNVKTHKPDNPLRPIISQIPTPTYQLAKKLNTLLAPYTPSGYSLRSADEFLDIVKASKPDGLLASLDVVSLFTNVPVEETIQIIIDAVWSHPSIPPLKMPKHILESMLRACTTEAPFRGPDGQLYRQVDGVAMGSPLGCLFADMYMCRVENEVLNTNSLKPHIYCRYVDDIFVNVKDEDHLTALKTSMEDHSVLQFTSEISNNNRLPFLDLDIEAENGGFKTKVYRKATDQGKTMHGSSECPKRYHKSVIRSFIRRAIKYSSEWSDVHHELRRCKQTLVNNGYSNTEIDAEISAQVERHQTRQETPKSETIALYYKNQMSPSYQVDEKVIQQIVHSNVKPTKEDTKLNLRVYYKNKKVRDLIMKNNINKDDNKLKKTNVVYKYTCPHEDCRLHPQEYISLTTTTLSRRLTMHLREGAPQHHTSQTHHKKITREDLTSNTTIMKSTNCRRRLPVIEALLIRREKPALNKQLISCVTLELFS